MKKINNDISNSVCRMALSAYAFAYGPAWKGHGEQIAMTDRSVLAQLNLTSDRRQKSMPSVKPI